MQLTLQSFTNELVSEISLRSVKLRHLNCTCPQTIWLNWIKIGQSSMLPQVWLYCIKSSLTLFPECICAVSLSQIQRGCPRRAHLRSACWTGTVIRMTGRSSYSASCFWSRDSSRSRNSCSSLSSRNSTRTCWDNIRPSSRSTSRYNHLTGKLPTTLARFSQRHCSRNFFFLKSFTWIFY